MIILGIDPGTTSIGYAVLDCTNRREPRILEARLLSLVSVALEDRLMTVHSEIKKIITQWHPHAASVEKLFFAKNTKTAIAVSETRGVILLTVKLAGIKVYEYTPLTIKKIVTGDGN
ncbi:MAG: crossover junction endodeoxyribonuclease RuvC, partial [Patescibacteria group bacterium]